jgi:site-specific DNA-methyltransferase (adenine-specific)
MSLPQSAGPGYRDDWGTPDCILERAVRLGFIGLDPCTTPDNPIGAGRFYAPPDNGLDPHWNRYGEGGLVYVNPPYGRPIKDWVIKCRDEAHLEAEIVLLVPANTDTLWFRIALGSARVCCFISGRLTFRGAPAPAKFGSAVFYFGPRPYLFAHAFSEKEFGRCWMLR